MNPLDNFIRNLTTQPGVYSMLDALGNILYIGKAKNLKKRVSSYFQRQLESKTLSLVQQINSIEITVTRNEREALLLESNLIKEHKPRYNIIFRDDKSYPYLYLSLEDQFPRLCFHRGERNGAGNYYGPYPSAKEAREALAFLQGVFKLRNCDNDFFKRRTRPCLQYQIKRCSGPCVSYVSEEEYKKNVDNAILFLEGKSDAVIIHLIAEMEVASEKQDYERAVKLRDQISVLRKIQEKQIIVSSKLNVDVLGYAILNDNASIHLLVIRDGRMLGSRNYFPSTTGIFTGEHKLESELLYTFIMQHYLKQLPDELPKELIIPCPIEDEQILTEVLSEHAKKQIKCHQPSLGIKQKWLEMAMESANKALNSRVTQIEDFVVRFETLQEALNLPAIPERIECFDVSHTLGEATVASCVVFDVNGPVKSAYRRFNIQGVTKGDDYKALRQALWRRYIRLKSSGESLPDVLLIDGGKGQLSEAINVLEELQVTGVLILAIAKGVTRRKGFETIFRANGEILTLAQNSKAFHLIQQIRDEAHRFAISAHRKQRAKRRMHSSLQDIPGIGKERRLAILQRFGGLQEVQEAPIEELAKVKGISLALAKRIYEALHGN